MHKSRRVKITDINPHLTCVLCSGYLIDATTIIECLHSFCRTCIVKYLESNKYCPICDVQVHKTKPLLNIRSDQTLQDIVYKLVPGLFQNEMCRRRDFYAKHPDQKPPSAEECGEVTQYSHIYTADESISLSLEYYNNNISYDNDNNTNAVETKMQAHPSRRFLRCPAAVSVSHLQKLIRAKYGLSTEHRVDILYMNDRLSEDFTLMDIAYIYLWRRKGPLHLTYRIFEVAKRIKLNDSPNEKSEIKTETKEEVKSEWKEVQLQISENGIMSITNIGEAKPPETVTSNVVEIKTEINLLKTDLPELSPIQKTEKPPEDKEIKKEQEVQEQPLVKLGKHKLQDSSDTNESSAKLLKPNPIKPVSTPVKNVQQLSRNHPLKIHSQAVTKNHVNPAKTVPQKPPIANINNNNTAAKIAVSSVQKDQIPAPITVQTTLPVQTPNLVTPKTSVQTPTSCPEKFAKTNVSITTTNSVVSSSTQMSLNTNLMMPNSPKYTQAGQSTNNTTTTKSDDVTTSNSLQKTPISSSSAAALSPNVNNCIQSSKVSIVPKKSPIKTAAYKTLRDPPKAWNPQIPRQNLTKPTVYPSNNGASTSDLNRVENRALAKPAKFFKMRNNVPRYLGNPASGVKPMYQVREGDSKSPPEVKKLPEIKKPVVETKLNNNNKDDVKIIKPETPEIKNKIDIKKQSIIKIDPKTLKPITQEVSTPSCSDNAVPEMKINQSTVPIFNPLRTQKSQTSPKIDRRSPKTTYLDIQNPPKSPMDRSSPKSTPGKPLNSPTSKKDKLSLNFTPPNPFIPNLASPNLAPNQFLYPNFPSYDPRVMNNLTAYHHPFSMYYSQQRLNYPGLSTQNLPLSPNLMSSLNLEVNKNLRKNYEMSLMQLSPTMESKKPATCVKSPPLNNEKPTDSKTFTKNNSINKNVKSEKASPIEPKPEPTNINNKEEKPKTTVEIVEQKPQKENGNEKPKTEIVVKDKVVENAAKEKKETVQENVDKPKENKETNQVEKSKDVQKPEEKKTEETEKSKEAVKST